MLGFGRDARIYRQAGDMDVLRLERGGEGLHLPRLKAAGIEHHGERIAAKSPIGEDVHGDVTPLHFDPPYPSRHTAIGRS